MTMQMHNFYQNSRLFFVGFNSINFDEEFFRQTLWEHFTFPYLQIQKETRGLMFLILLH